MVTVNAAYETKHDDTMGINMFSPYVDGTFHSRVTAVTEEGARAGLKPGGQEAQAFGYHDETLVASW